MNFKKPLLFVALVTLSFVGCKQTDSSAPSADKNITASLPAKPETASFTIEGMSCAIGCAKTIEKKLAAMDGITKASVDFDKKEAKVEFDANKQTPEKIAQAVEATADGKTYKVSNLKSSGNHAMYFGEPKAKAAKAKKDKKSKAQKTEKKAGEEKSTEETPACCSGKKACHT